MAINRKAFPRLIRSPLTWLIAAVVIGSILGWLAISASAHADRGGQPNPARVVANAIAGADVLLPSSALASPHIPASADGG